ncbi:MAG: M15 family metallopeptidase [Capsulimonadales bacterium]|nr:M15 family metallopeptidase [Capsulimonadales bacterium]
MSRKSSPLKGSPEPFGALNRIPIVECGEPLVDLRDACPHVLLRPGCLPYLRRTVALMLNRANDRLPEGYRYSVSTALRTLEMQSEMYWRNYNRLKAEKPHLPVSALRRITNKYFAAPDYPAPPGHTTGGAIDVALLGPDFETQDVTSPTRGWEAAYTWSDLIGPEAKRNRMLLVETLLSVGFSNCRDEWWHFSYGDNAWAVRHGCSVAMYGLAAPPEGFTLVVKPWRQQPARVGFRTVGPRVFARNA